MKSYYILILASLLLVSCNSGRKSDTVLLKDLKRIESSLSSSISNKLTGIQIEYELNPQKWIESLEKAKYIETTTDSLLELIHSDEDLKDNLHEIIDEFLQVVTLLELNNKDFTRNRNEIFNYWRTTPVKNTQRVSFAIDLRLCISEIIEELIDQVDSKSFTFNALEPVIIKSSNKVSPGDTFEAKIGIHAYDSTMVHEVKFDEYYLDVQSGYGIYRATSNTPGIKRFSGSIIVMRNDHEVDTLYYNESYEVK